MKSQIPISNSQSNPKSQFPKLVIGHWSLGFTLIELLIVIFIIGLLSSIVTVNFKTQRSSQEIQIAGQDLISNLREIQNLILTGKQVAGGQAATAYEITFSIGSQNYTVDYYLGTDKTSYKTIALSQNIAIGQLYRSAVPEAQMKIRFDAPYGKITVDGQANQIGEVQLRHATEERVSAIIVDGISGRIGLK